MYEIYRQKRSELASNRFKRLLSAFIVVNTGYFLYTNRTILKMALMEKNTRAGSREVGLIGQMKIPFYLRSLLFSLYSSFYKVVVDDMVQPFNSYETLNDFFTREVKPRSITSEPSALVVPADSKVLSIEKITGDQVIAVKGVNYSIGQFLNGKDSKLSKLDIKKLKKNPSNDLYSVVFYLAPGDYHRYHSHDQMNIDQITHIPGHLLKVKDTEISPTTYTENERIIVNGKSDFGNFYYGIVGATNVGSMELAFDPDVLSNSESHDSKVNI